MSAAGATAVDEAHAADRQQQRDSARWWAAAFVLIGVVLLGATAALGWDRPAHDDLALHADRLLELLAFLTFVLLGALLVLRRPEHPIGWLLAALGLAVLVNQVSQEYALQHVAGQAWTPAGGVALWIAAGADRRRGRTRRPVPPLVAAPVPPSCRGPARS